MKLIIGTQIGFIVGGIISVTLLNIDLEIIIGNHIVLTLGYFCRWYQVRG